MIKITSIALVAAATLLASSAVAGDKACCAKGASHADKTACADLAFLKQAKGILSAEQFAQLEATCKKPANAKKTQA